MPADRYIRIGNEMYKCVGCGCVIADMDQHDIFHELISKMLEMNKLLSSVSQLRRRRDDVSKD